LNLPLFPLGFEVGIGYMGLTKAGERCFDREGKTIDNRYRIAGIRLLPRASEDADNGNTIIKYPQGWEYLFVQTYRRRGDWYENYYEDGWTSEETLLKAGYQPPLDNPATAS
jgi:hypothetical protein